FDYGHRGIQANVFFAGVVLSANATNPNFANTRTNLGADLFAIAVPTTNSMYRGGIEQKSEAVKSLPTWISMRAGHPYLPSAKIAFELALAHISYRRGADTAKNFGAPPSTFVITPQASTTYARGGYTASAWYDFNRRTNWKPWGVLSEYNPNQ